MIAKLPKRKYTQITPGRAFYEFTLDKHLKELRDDDEDNAVKNDSPGISPEMSFTKTTLTTISFTNNSWYEVMFSIDGITLLPRTKIMKSFSESKDTNKFCEFNFRYKLPKTPVKLRVDILQPHSSWIVGGLENMLVEYKKTVDVGKEESNHSDGLENSENIETLPEIQVPKKRWTLDPGAEYKVLKLFI